MKLRPEQHLVDREHEMITHVDDRLVGKSVVVERTTAAAATTTGGGGGGGGCCGGGCGSAAAEDEEGKITEPRKYH